jgi:deoxyribonuclease-4
MFLGSHVSIRNGYLGAAQTALKLGAKAYQYFPKNPRSLSVKEYDHQDAKACADFCKEKGLRSIAHTPYPTSLTEEKQSLRQLNIESVLNDLEIAEACGSIGIVVHFGKYKGHDPLKGYKIMIEMLNDILAAWQGRALLLIENNAGQGVKMGTTLEELVQVRNLANHPEKIGFCLDTCHAFASGLWKGQDWQEVIQKGENLGFFTDLQAIHLNDSAYPTGSFRDRHANVGKGHIGEKYMQELLTSPIVKGLPVILETPTTLVYTHADEIRYVSQLAH